MGGEFKNIDAVGILIPDKSHVQMVKECPVVKWLGFHIAPFSWFGKKRFGNETFLIQSS